MLQPGKIPVDKIIGETENDFVLSDGSVFPKQPPLQASYAPTNMFQAPPPPTPATMSPNPMGRRIVSEDDVSFTTDDGLRIAKNALTPERVGQLRNQIQAPPLSLDANISAAPIAPEPMPMDMPPAQQPVTQPSPNMPMPEMSSPAPLPKAQTPKYVLPDVPKNIEQLNAETDRQIAERQQQLNQLADNYAKDIGDVTAQLAKPIEPGRYLSNMSNGNKVLAAISLMASGIGSGLGGGQNMAMGVINKAIDEDINAQKAAYDNARSSAALKNNIYANFKERYQNDMVALQAMKQFRLNQVQQAIQARIDASKDQREVLKLNAELQRIGSEIKRNQVETTLKIREQMAKEQQAAQPQGQVQEGFTYNGKFIPGKEENYAPGIGTMWTAEEAKTARKQSGELGALNKSVDSLISNLEKRGSFAKLGIEQRGDIEDEVNNIITLGRSILGSDNLSDRQMKSIEKFIPNPNNITTWDSRSIRDLQDFKRIINRNFQERYKNLVKYPDPTTQAAMADFKPE